MTLYLTVRSYNMSHECNLLLFRPLVSEPINSSLFQQLAEQLQQQNLEQFQKQLLEHQQHQKVQIFLFCFLFFTILDIDVRKSTLNILGFFPRLWVLKDKTLFFVKTII